MDIVTQIFMLLLNAAVGVLYMFYLKTSVEKHIAGYKSSLEKQKIIFNLQLRAIEDINALMDLIYVKVYSQVDDGFEVFKNITHDFYENKEKISNYLNKYKIVLPKASINALKGALEDANLGCEIRFDINSANPDKANEPYEPCDKEVMLARKMFDGICNASDILEKDIRGQLVN